MILQAVFLRSNKVAALVLSDSDVPGSGSGGGGRVDIYVDGHTVVTGGHPHMLAGIVATDDGWASETRNPDYKYDYKVYHIYFTNINLRGCQCYNARNSRRFAKL